MGMAVGAAFSGDRAALQRLERLAAGRRQEAGGKRPDGLPDWVRG